MPETGTSGSMSGVWKRSMVRLVRLRQPKGSETDRLNLNHRATPRLYRFFETRKASFMVQSRCQRGFETNPEAFDERTYHNRVFTLPRNF